MRWVYDDGGRKANGYSTDYAHKDCVCRAIAIATGIPYQDVFDGLNREAKKERKSKRKKTRSNANTGVYKRTIDRYMESIGWEWVPCMKVGTGCQVHLREDELPSGRIVVRVSKHICAVIDRVIHDIYDPSREGTRCVYGYWREKEG